MSDAAMTDGKEAAKKAKKSKKAEAEPAAAAAAPAADAAKEKKKKSKKADGDSKDTKSAAAADSGDDKEDVMDEAEMRLRAGISIIADPLANKKLTKHCLKLVDKAAKAKSIRRGVKEVVKAIRKGEKGVMILAGNITPIDVITHIPILCEEFQIPYVYVPSKEQLGAAGSTKRPTSCVLVTSKEDSAHREYFVQVKAEIQAVTPVVPR